jgi:hypothetical protein
MFDNKLPLGLSLVACVFALLLVPVLASAQLGGVVQGTKHGVQKGAGAVKQGAEGAAEKTKEGAEAVGHGTKKVITGKENNPQDNRMKPSETQPESQPQSQPESQPQQRSTETKGAETGEKNLPKTAGELPFLALAGFLSLAGAGVSRVLRRD